jgi:hypothetical protein
MLLLVMLFCLRARSFFTSRFTSRSCLFAPTAAQLLHWRRQWDERLGPLERVEQEQEPWHVGPLPPRRRYER